MSEAPYTGPDYGGCPWPIDPSCNVAGWTSLSPAQQARGLALATSTLRRLTGNRVGGCPVTFRPTRSCECTVSYLNHGAFSPGMNVAGQWVNNAGCGTCGASPGEISLPAPVGQVYDVQVNGVSAAPGDFRVDQGHLLVWQGSGPNPWLSFTQNFSVPDRAVGSFSITYLNSYPVDRLGAQAAATLAYEFALACKTSTAKNCRLPASVVSVVRQGVSYELQPGLFPDGFTGIEEVDVFITAWNPRALVQDSAIWAPGQSRGRTSMPSIGAPLVYDGGVP